MVGRSVPPVGMLKVETLTFVHVGGRGSTGGEELADQRREASEEIERTMTKLREPHDRTKAPRRTLHDGALLA